MLTGGKGCNLLIAGPQPATLIGGTDQDILVGGTAAYDSKVSALNALMAEWSRTGLSYAARVNSLLKGGPGQMQLNGSTFHSNGGSNTLTGGAGLDLFYGNKARDISDWSAAQGEVFVEDQNLPSVTITTKGLSTQSLVLDGNVALPGSGSTLLALAVGSHTLADANNPAAAVQFSVGPGGAISYAPSLQGVLTGSGTSTLVVHGLAVTIDATALSSQTSTFTLANLGTFSTSQPQTFQLLTPTYSFQAGSLSFSFTLSAQDQLDYDVTLDGQVSGRGTNTLIVT